MDENDRCDEHGRRLDHPWGCFGCALAVLLAEDPETHEPGWCSTTRACAGRVTRYT